MTGPLTEEFLRGILESALTAIEAGRRGHIYRRDHATGRKVIYHLARDLDKLNACCPEFSITTERDYWGIIIDCLEVALENPLATYRRPEESICSHEEAFGKEMYAFVAELKDFTRPIYTKFCLVEQADGTCYICIDCHT